MTPYKGLYLTLESNPRGFKHALGESLYLYASRSTERSSSLIVIKIHPLQGESYCFYTVRSVSPLFLLLLFILVLLDNSMGCDNSNTVTWINLKFYRDLGTHMEMSCIVFGTHKMDR